MFGNLSDFDLYLFGNLLANFTMDANEWSFSMTDDLMKKLNHVEELHLENYCKQVRCIQEIAHGLSKTMLFIKYFQR